MTGAASKDAIERFLEEAGVAPARRARARLALLREPGAKHGNRSGSVLEPPGGALWDQVRQAGLRKRMASFIGAQACQYAFFVLSWWAAGQAALGHGQRGDWLLVWALLLFGSGISQLIATGMQGQLTVEAGQLLRRRLLDGALKLEWGFIRVEGVGRLLGRVLESETVELLAVSGGLQALAALVELGMAVVVLTIFSPLHLVLLAAWLGFVVFLALTFRARQMRWTKLRLELTHDVIEKMIGQRTRLAQRPREEWHEGEDDSLARYRRHASTMDQLHALLLALVPRGWLVLALAGLVALVALGQTRPLTTVITLGGLLLAYQALRTLSYGMSSIVAAAGAWKQLAPILEAAGAPAGSAVVPIGEGQVEQESDIPTSQSVIEACDVGFHYPSRLLPTLDGCTLSVRTGDRVLIEGAAGSGKSTLALVLAGLLTPSVGTLMLDDRKLAPIDLEQWRRDVLLVPQLQMNHIITASLAFNLLLGSRWPPEVEDLARAEAVIRGLGLGDLLDRMPAGIHQMMGETGWQLSQGEQSLVCLGRALIQGGELVVLDESLGALDPQRARQALALATQRFPALLVIAQ